MFIKTSKKANPTISKSHPCPHQWQPRPKTQKHPLWPTKIHHWPIKKAHSYPSNNRPKPNNIQHESTSHNNPLQLTKKTHYDQSNNPSQPITMSAQKVTIDHQSTQNRNCESVIVEPERASKKEEIYMWKNWIMFRNLYMIIYKNTTQNKRRDHKNTWRLFSTNSFAL